jgi:cellulose synthase operon protein C
VRPDFSGAIARYEELIRRYPTFERIEAASYTLGTLYSSSERFAEAAPLFERVAGGDSSGFEAEALFRLGDARFELASKERGTPRRAGFARAARAYEQATAAAPANGDIYFLSLYKLGWSYYNQATQTNQDEYRQAVNVFGRLVDAYDKLTPEQQARLGLRGEAIEYMAIAFTQVGGAEAANRYFASRGGAPYQQPVLRRVAASLREQGDFSRAVEAYRVVVSQSPTDSSALTAQREIVDIYQNRMLEPARAQEARLALVEMFAPNSAWAQANPALADSAAVAREAALRQSAQYVLAQAQEGNDRRRFAEAAALYQRYVTEFPTADSARVARTYLAEALFRQGEYARAGAEYVQAAYGAAGDSAGAVAEQAGRNAIVAYDSALVRNRTDRAAQDSLFAVIDRFATTFPRSNIARTALVQKGRRASETQRWDVMASTFRTYAERYPNDPFTPTAQKLVGDALYRSGNYAEAQQQWESAETIARRSGRSALVDTIASVRTTAAASFADTLVRAGEYRRAAEEVYVAYADKNPNAAKAPDALRDAIETYMLADSVARRQGNAEASTAARERAIELSRRLFTTYPRYQYRTQYQSLHARLLAETGKREEAVSALQALIAGNPSWSGRPDAMIRLAVSLDSLGRKRDAAAAYEAFVAAYPRDRRAADAQYNAAVTYVEAGDSTAAGRAYGTFAQRFPRDTRAAQARTTRLALLRASGDTATVNAELATLCARNPTGDLRTACADRVGQGYFRRGAALFPTYKAIELVIPTKAQLTAAGVQRASARKQQMLREMTSLFTRAIESGSPEYLSAATYYVGLAQWEYGEFVKNVRLPTALTEEERAEAAAGSARQAEQYYTAARNTWQQLLEKAQAERIDNAWVTRTREAIAGNIPATPPTGPEGGP